MMIHSLDRAGSIPRDLASASPQRKDVQTPADEEQEDHAGDDDHGQGGDIRPGDACQTAQEPERDGGEGVQGVSQVFEQGDEGIEKATRRGCPSGSGQAAGWTCRAGCRRKREKRPIARK